MHLGRLKFYRTLAMAFVAGLFLAVSPNAEAARITKVKGKQVLIEIEDTEMDQGQKFFVIIDGKRKGVVQITKISKGRALATLTKGRAEVDSTLMPTKKVEKAVSDEEILGSGKKKTQGDDKSESDDADSTQPSTYIGVMAGYAMDSQNVTDSSGNSYAMPGSGYSFKGFGDIPLSPKFGLIARSGIEQVNFSGSSQTTSILYLSVDALLRYEFTTGSFAPYIAGGMGIHYPLSKSSTILDVSKISTTTIFFVPVIGFNIKLGKSTLLVASFEYGYFPPSNNVTTNLITGRIGLGWRY